ncbi:putative sensor histidine kinase protein [Fulvimarina pelagi HTCC2506]|uniref:histidine kinase n=1 Tax=Fulvimarina pelagi HTCC2506 TaxID=314231 RepID=Q0G245_9HYPH|nr:putative sensor histidine kinase protein [Fulvimarina pelagi HTCC2506]
MSTAGQVKERSREALVALSEIGTQPVAIWSSVRSWFDAGFGDAEQVYLEDLYDLKDSDDDRDIAFLPSGKTIGLAKINRRLIAVWHHGDTRLLDFDLAPATASATGGEPHTSPAEASDMGVEFDAEAAVEDEESANPLAMPIDEIGAEHASASRSADAVLSSEGDSRVIPELPDWAAGSPPAMAFIGGGIGAAAAYHFAQAEIEEDGNSLEDAVVEQFSPEAGATDPSEIAEKPSGRVDRHEKDPGFETGNEPTFVDADLEVVSDSESVSDEEVTPIGEASRRRAPVRSNWSGASALADATSMAATPEVKASSEESEAAHRSKPFDGDTRQETAFLPDESRTVSSPAAGEPDFGSSKDFVPDFSERSKRFVWRLDQEGRFHALSPEFASVVGPRAADVIGIAFADLSEALDLDPSGEIASLIDRRDTWSDRSVLWPVEASDKRVPIDLAALPVYSRDRSFDGFRGFGVLRPAEAETDPENWGKRLANGETMHEIVAEAVRSRPVEVADFGTEDDDEDANTLEQITDDASGLPDETEQIVRLADRRLRRDAPLSDEEAAAFRTIGVALSGSERGGNLDAAIQTAKEKIALFGGPPLLSSANIHRKRHAGDTEAGSLSEPQRQGSDLAIATDLAAYYGRLPVPILVQSGDHTVFTNEEFADLTGYRDATALSAAGGLDRLFDESERGECVRLRRANGKTIDVRARMQRITMRGRSFLVISFFATPRMTVSDLQPKGAPLITEDKADDVEALDAEARLAQLMASVEAAGEAVLVLDHEGRVEAANERGIELFASAVRPDQDHVATKMDDDGAAPSTPLQGFLFTKLFEGESRSLARELIRETSLGLREDRAGGDADLAVRIADGEPRKFTTVAEPLETGGWCVVMRDLGEPGVRGVFPDEDEDVRTAQHRAEADSVRKTQLLASVSHEIRTPMTAVLGFADAIEGEAFGPIGNPRYLDYIADIKRSSRHVLDLVNDLLELSKAEAGGLELDFRTVALNQVVGEVVSMMQPVAGGARIVLRSNLPPSVPQVVADERSIRQIMTNLVQNAINSTPAGGQIIVSSQYREDGSVTLRCRDNGVGMNEKELEFAKQPFGRPKLDGGPRRRGTGLGLPLAYAMAEANGAAIAIDSAPQNGTMVELRFPPGQVVPD